MLLDWKLGRILAVAGIALILSGCEKGPLEKAGKAIDRAGEKTGEKLKEITK